MGPKRKAQGSSERESCGRRRSAEIQLPKLRTGRPVAPKGSLATRGENECRRLSCRVEWCLLTRVWCGQSRYPPLNPRC